MQRPTVLVSLKPPPTVRSGGRWETGPALTPWVQPPNSAMGVLMMAPGQAKLNSDHIRFQEGDFFFVPAGYRVAFDFDSDDNILYSLIGAEWTDSTQDIFPIPLYSQLGDEAQHWDRLVRIGLNRLHLTRGPLLAAFMGILWSIAELDRPFQRSIYVEDAERIIENRLNQQIRIDRLAAELGISQSQLNRLFLSELNQTPLQYVQAQRAKRALNLLTRTVMPIKQVASECGFPDSQSFSRFVRARLGSTPRKLRLGPSTHLAFFQT